MHHNKFHFGKLRLVMAALLALGIRPAMAKDAELVSGSYQVMQNRALGSQSQIRLRIHLVNHGPSDLAIQKMTLSDFSHQDKAGTRACTITLGPHSTADTIQEFSIPRSEYTMWHRGLRPRFLLQLAGPGNTKSNTVVRLDPISGQEAK
jgi:hypothetical protein